MKKIGFSIILSTLFIVNFTYGQKKGEPFTGDITVSITYDGTWDAATLAMQPKEFTILLSEKKQKVTVIAGGAVISTITNTIDSSVTTLINAMGMKFYYRKTKDEILQSLGDLEAPPKINYLDETKIIAGYECKKAEYITMDEYGDEVITVVYYTQEIGNPAFNFGGEFSGLKGYPMGYSVKTDEGTINFEVKELKYKKKIKDVEFMIPSDYEKMTEEMIKSLEVK